ncbi:hypothetical protein BC332_33445 [Capsicum chinense]|nr:hypothetical protein BC332_33445 [Capsicum chinense]
MVSFACITLKILKFTTGEIKALSFSVNDVKSPLYPPRLCLGFDLVMEKYKLLQLFVENNNNNNKLVTLGRDSCWRYCCHHMSLSIFHLRCNFLNGVLYWAQSRIFYFDLTKEELQSSSLPEGYNHCAELDSMQTALRGKLVMHCYNTEKAENIVELEQFQFLATRSIVNADTYLEFQFEHVMRMCTDATVRRCEKLAMDSSRQGRGE